jgi:hypothetical protein
LGRAILGAVAIAGCSSGASTKPPALGDAPSSSSSTSTGTGIDAGVDAQSSTSAASSASSSASSQGDLDASADATPPGDSGEDRPDVFVNQGSDASMTDPSCRPTTTWGAPAAVPGVPTFSTEPIVTLTADELTLAWVLDAGAGQGSVYVTDRASTSDAFPAANALVAQNEADGGGEIYFGFARVAITGDGLTLAGVAVGGQQFAEFTRAARSQPFAPGGLAYPFQPITTQLVEDFRGGSLTDPVVSADGTDLLFSIEGFSSAASVYESRAPSGIYSAGIAQGDRPLQGDAGARKHPTSLTADHLNLFYWDDGTGMAYVVQRGTPTADLNFSWSIGAFESVQSNGGCSRIYYVMPVAGGSGYTLVSAAAQ